MRISDWSSDVCSSDLGEISLRHRLEDQFLRNALVVIAFKPSEQITLVREEKRALNFEPIGREPLEADRRIGAVGTGRSEEHTSELQSLMRISYAVFCMKKKNRKRKRTHKKNKS